MTYADAGFYLDRGALTFDVYVSYSIDAYNDPETGEYFGDTSWTYQFTDLDSGLSGSNGGYGDGFRFTDNFGHDNVVDFGAAGMLTVLNEAPDAITADSFLF